MSQIFRQSTLDRLSSPEQLDQLVRITSPRSWLFLASLLIVLLIFLTWGVFGTVSTRIAGQGILLSGQVHDVVPLYAGQITHLAVDLGDSVRAGDVVARVAQPALVQQLSAARARLRERRLEAQNLETFGQEEGELQEEVAARQRANLETLIGESEARAARLDQQVEVERELLAEGLITRAQVQSIEQEAENTRNQIDQYRADLASLEASIRSTSFDLQQRLETARIQVEDAARFVEELEGDLAEQAAVRSPYDGEVLQLMMSEGELVSPGMSILKLAISEEEAEALRVIVYVPLHDGKKVSEGMPIEVSPATVPPEQDGYMKATIIQVADFPSTQRSMLNVLKNDQLVQQLSASGAPFEVEARLEPDAGTFSGYAWTSGDGPAVKIHSGTPITGWTIVAEQRPIELVIPSIRKAFSF